jgi:hypothetical protein
MAKIALPLSHSARLPRCCFICGDRDASFRRVTLKPQGSDENMLAYAVYRGYRILTLTLPLCDAHRGHFNLQTWLRYGAIAGVVLIACVGIIPAMTLRMPILMLIPLLGVIGGAVGWYLLSAKLNRGRVHVVDFSDDTVTFTNVSKDFVEAFQRGPFKPQPQREKHDDDLVAVESVEDRHPHTPPRRLPERRADQDADRDADRDADEEVFDDEAPTRGSGISARMIVVACGILIVLVVVALGLAMAFSGNRTQRGPIVIHDQRDKKAKPKPPEPPGIPPEIAKLEPHPLPIDPGWNEQAMERTYLTDLPEFDTATGWGKFGKNGMLGYPKWGFGGGNDPILIQGKPATKGLSFTAGSGSHGRAKYRLDGSAKLLTGAVAMSDMPPESNLDRATSPFWFTIWGDDRLLWKSRPIQLSGESEPFRISVAGVKTLEIRVSNPLHGHHIRGAWIDPAIFK